MMWFKGQTIGTGQCPVKKYDRALRDLVAGGKARPSFIVSHELPLDRAPEAYRNFDSRETAGPRSCSPLRNGPLPAVGAAAPAADPATAGLPRVKRSVRPASSTSLRTDGAAPAMRIDAPVAAATSCTSTSVIRPLTPNQVTPVRSTTSKLRACVEFGQERGLEDTAR